MLRARRHALPLLAGAALVVFACQPVQLSVVNIVLLGRTKNYDGNDRLTFKADVYNASSSDIVGAWAQVTGGVPAGATILDDILQFGPTPASGTSTSTDGFIVIVPPGAAFDPTVLTWTMHPGLRDGDLDGLPDGRELDIYTGTDPANPDTDGDRFGDGVEVVMGSDPKDAQSTPTSFPDGLFYSTSSRPNGMEAIALGGPSGYFPPGLTLVGPGAPGPAGLAFDRNGFLYGARGGDVAHIDALTGQLLGDVSLHDPSGNPLQATQLAYDPTTDTFIAVKNDPATGSPTTQLLQVDVHTGLATPLAVSLPGTPRAITIRPEIDATDGYRWLYAVIEDGAGTQQVYEVELGGVISDPVGSPLPTPVTGLAFDHQLDLLQAGPLGNGQTGVWGGPVLYGPFDGPLGGLAVPPPCPAPCFAPAVYAGAAQAIAVADINGDGHPDVVAATDFPSGLDWYANDGSGNLVAQPATTTTDTMASVAVADFDGDGHLDAVLVTNSSELQWARGHGAGAFDPPVPLARWAWPPVQAGDVTGDGAPDIVDSQITMVNDGTGTFTPYQYAFGSPNAVAIAKLDSGPVRQVVAIYAAGGTTPGEVAVFAWQGPFQGFVETGRQTLDFNPTNVSVGDLNGDGFDDVVVSGLESGGNTAAAATLEAAGDGTLLAPARLASVPGFLGYRSPVVADVTGDGRADIVLNACPNPARGARVLVGDGTGHFQAAAFDVDSGFDCNQDLAAADFDGDGLVDLIGSYGVGIVRSLPVYPVK